MWKNTSNRTGNFRATARLAPIQQPFVVLMRCVSGLVLRSAGIYSKLQTTAKERELTSLPILLAGM